MTDAIVVVAPEPVPPVPLPVASESAATEAIVSAVAVGIEVGEVAGAAAAIAAMAQAEANDATTALAAMTQDRDSGLIVIASLESQLAELRALEIARNEVAVTETVTEVIDVPPASETVPAATEAPRKARGPLTRMFLGS